MKREIQNFKDFLREAVDPSYYQETFNFTILISMVKAVGGSRDETKNDIRALPEVLTVTLVEKSKGGIQKDAGTKFLSTLKVHVRRPKGSAKEEMMRRVVSGINGFRGVSVIRYKEKIPKKRRQPFRGPGSYTKRVQESEYQKSVKKKHRRLKIRLIGKGNQPNVPPYSKKPSMDRSKSAPAGFGALEEEAIEEAMKSTADLPENIVVVIDKKEAPATYKIYYATKDNLRSPLRAGDLDRMERGIEIYGTMTIQLGQNFPYEGHYLVTSVRAADGFGPLLYDVALETAGKSGLKPDVISVSDEASAVWKQYDSARQDVQGKLLVYDIDMYQTVMPSEHAEKPYESEHLAQVYYKRGKSTSEELQAAQKLIDIYRHAPLPKINKQKSSGLSRFDRLREEIRLDIKPSSNFSAFDIKPDLQQKIWDGSQRIRPGIRAALLDIVEDFKEKLDLDIEVEDIVLTGSLANYNWSRYSDLDIHIIINFSEVGENVEIIKKFFAALRSNWNQKHDIRVKEHEVELYIQSHKEPHISTGVYSLLNDEWVVKPNRVKPYIDDELAERKAKDIQREVDKLENLLYTVASEKILERSNRLKERLKKMRETGLKREGIFSPENLAFKILRRSGVIEKLYKVHTDAYDLSMGVKQ